MRKYQERRKMQAEKKKERKRVNKIGRREIKERKRDQQLTAAEKVSLY